MQETQELKRTGYIGYRLLDNGLYELVDFEYNEVLNTMPNVAILFDGNVLLKHGHPNEIKEYFDELVSSYRAIEFEHNLNIIQGRIPIDELDKVLTITSYPLGKKLDELSS